MSYNFKIKLDEDGYLDNIIFNDKSLKEELECVFKADVEFDCMGSTPVVLLKCYADNVEIIKDKPGRK